MSNIWGQYLQYIDFHRCLDVAKAIADLAPIATLFIVWNGIKQLKQNSDQSLTVFEDSLTKEYRDLMRLIPYQALLGRSADELKEADIPPEKIEEAKEAVYNYLDFCNQQVFLRQKERIREDTWQEWNAGIKINLELSFFKEVMEDVTEAHPEIFKELRQLKEKRFEGDPNSWEKK